MASRRSPLHQFVGHQQPDQPGHQREQRRLADLRRDLARFGAELRLQRRGGLLSERKQLGPELFHHADQRRHQFGTGILALASSSNSNIESTLNADISKENSLISAQQTSLTAELNSANEIMQQLPSQLDGVNELYSAITGYNQNSNG
jgi:hypothetical protein